MVYSFYIELVLTIIMGVFSTLFFEETAAAESFAYRIVEGISPLGLGPVSVFLSDGYRRSYYRRS